MLEASSSTNLEKVLVGFLVIAYMSLFIVCIYYCLGLVAEEYMNTIDKGVVNVLWRKAHSRPARTWEPTLRTAVLMYSDQQIVTVIAILTSGYAQLRCGLSVYLWEIIIYLAWHSSLTHLTTFTFLREYFRNNAVARIWRAILMLSMAIMLSIALLSTGDRRWVPNDSDDMKTLSAWCAFKRLATQKPSE